MAKLLIYVGYYVKGMMPQQETRVKDPWAADRAATRFPLF
jgi:hypothetical protein